MSVYAIGDIQGCYDELRELLDMIEFDPGSDKLWFVGDLVNRGPKSLEVLRFVKSLGDSAVSVLGNHDLHLLAMVTGNKLCGPSSTLTPVLKAPDRSELLHWLRWRPLMHHDPELGFSMVHAGLPPQWSVTEALEHAAELEAVLRDDAAYPGFFAEMYGNRPRKWDGELQGIERLRFITNVFTRLRYCTRKGKLALNESGPLGTQGKKLLPWFMVPGRRSAKSRIVFGHWSTLGYLAGANVWALDTGCLWGGALTALRLDDQVPLFHGCTGQRKPG